MKLKRDFYIRDDVEQIAQDLLGKVLFTRLNGKVTGGIIIETEAYKGIVDRASHSYSGRRTKRTEVMYSTGGTAYIYLCYGMHHLFNVVTNKKNIPDAILIRTIKPFIGIETILRRRRGGNCSGPGTVSQGLGIKICYNGTNLLGRKIWIEDRGIKIPSRNITKSPRIGVNYAGADALLPYRFVAKI